MNNLSIRPFREGDIEFAYKLDVMEQWGDTRRDIRRMFSYEPEGCFIAEVDGEPVGHVFSVSYKRLGWIGLLILETEYRRRGIGTILTKKAMAYLLSCGVETIKLEVVPALSKLYRKLGFKGEYDSLRFMGVREETASSRNYSINVMKRRGIKELASFDAEYFGANRIKVLSNLQQENPELCLVSSLRSRIVGYIICRKAETGHRIGPWVCNPEHPRAARELLTRCMETVGHNERFFVGVPAVNEKAVEILKDLNFKQYSKSVRMYFGKKLKTECAEGIFAIGGPEKG